MRFPRAFPTLLTAATLSLLALPARSQPAEPKAKKAVAAELDDQARLAELEALSDRFDTLRYSFNPLKLREVDKALREILTRELDAMTARVREAKRNMPSFRHIHEERKQQRRRQRRARPAGERFVDARVEAPPPSGPDPHRVLEERAWLKSMQKWWHKQAQDFARIYDRHDPESQDRKQALFDRLERYFKGQMPPGLERPGKTPPKPATDDAPAEGKRPSAPQAPHQGSGP